MSSQWSHSWATITGAGPQNPDGTSGSSSSSLRTPLPMQPPSSLTDSFSSSSSAYAASSDPIFPRLPPATATGAVTPRERPASGDAVAELPGHTKPLGAAVPGWESAGWKRRVAPAATDSGRGWSRFAGWWASTTAASSGQRPGSAGALPLPGRPTYSNPDPVATGRYTAGCLQGGIGRALEKLASGADRPQLATVSRASIAGQRDVHGDPSWGRSGSGPGGLSEQSQP